jgi:phosphatidylserine/phosphatidylglycerophosphate/cardiolipin synthase-like enzyme
MTKKTRSTKPSTRKPSAQGSTTKKPAAKRSSAKRSTARRSSSGRKSPPSQGQQARLKQVLAVGIVVVLVIAGGYYLFTGTDPLGLFAPAEEAPVGETRVTEIQAEEVSAPEAPSPPGAGGGDWWQVYFTDPQKVNDPGNLSGSIPEKLIALIDSAQHTIHIASFEFNLTPVAEALIAAHKRGVEVQWVTDDEHGIEADEEEDHGQFKMLTKAGIEVRDDDRGALMHDKFWIFDGQTVWTGSTNITVNGNFRNNNNVIVIDSPELAAIYEREFAEMWEGEFGPTSPSTVDDQAVTIDGTPIQVLFAAEDEVASRLVPLIEGAQRTVRFMAFSFTHEALGAAVLARAKAGVDVEGIFETRGSETEYSELPMFYCAGMAVRQDGNPGTFHHKVFVIDGEIVITGSLNFSDNADESNDENVLIVRNGDIAAQYLQEFERRWAEAVEPDKADMNCK